MAGGFSVGGLISGLDSNTLIRQLIQLDRQPVLRIQERIGRLEQQRDAIRDLRTQLQTLRNRAQDFRLAGVFSKFTAPSTNEDVATAAISGPSPTTGAYTVNVTQLATATSAVGNTALGAPIDPNASLQTSGIATEVQAGTFTINGVQFTVDPGANSLNNLLNQINSSTAGVTAAYDAVTDTVSLTNSAPGDTSLINLGASGDTSNLLTALRLKGANQSPGPGGSTQVTSTRNLGSIDPAATLNTVNFRNGPVTGGAFSINGVSITVDPAADSIQNIVNRINASDAQVSATYDSATDTIRVTATALGSPTIKFGAPGDTSNFLSVTGLDNAIQTPGNDAEFSINGGAPQTRNTNDITDAIGGVTLTLRSLGTASVTVSLDDEGIVEQVQEFIEAFNASINQIRSLSGNEGALRGDAGIRAVGDFLRTTIFAQVPEANGIQSLIDVGFSTGSDFNPGETPQISLDTEAFLEALRENPSAIEQLFSNPDKTGIADRLFEYLDEATSISGFLNARARANGTIDRQIRALNDQIDRIEDRLLQKEDRLRRQFLRLEQLTAAFQNQSASLSRLGAGMMQF